MNGKVIAYALLLIALVAGGLVYGHVRYTAGRNDLIAEQQASSSKAVAAAQARAVAGDAGAAQATHAGEVAQAAAQVQTQTVVQTVTRYIHDSPAPAVCVMPAADPVLRELTDAAGRANAALDRVQGTKPSAPAGSGTGQL